jgi:glucose-6-phosphate 1-epimerase
VPPADRFVRTSLPSTVRLIDAPAGLPHLDITTPAATARAFFHGAHVAEWQPAHAAAPVLWLSPHSFYRQDKSIRGGVPICFPWFGDRLTPAHGFARLMTWPLTLAADEADGTVTLAFTLETDEHTSPLWPHRSRATYRASIGSTLALTLEVENRGDVPFAFEEALHTYLAVQDITQVSIGGLEQTEYLDKPTGFARRQQGSEAIRFLGETDRVYLDTTSSCRVVDRAGSRTIVVSKSDSRSTVVWNPWADRAAALPDFGADQWRRMVCVETANVGAAVIHLEPGTSHAMRAVVAVE